MSIPPEIRYVCDGMVEHMDVTADVGAYMSMLYRGNWDWYDNYDSSIQDVHDAAKEVYLNWRRSAPRSHRRICDAAGVNMWEQHIHPIIQSVMMDIMLPLCEDLLEGKRKKELFSKTNIRKAIRKNKKVLKARRIYGNFLQRSDLTAENLLSGYIEGQRLLYSNDRDYNKVLRRERGHLTWKEKREIRQERKKSIKAVSMLSKIAGRETTGLYIGGETVVIRGKLLEYHITKNNFNSNDYSSNMIKLHDLDGNFLSNICVYFNDTPAAEQIAGFMLYVQTGLEEEILKTGNLHSISEHGRDHPVIKRIQEMKSNRGPLRDIILADVVNEYNAITIADISAAAKYEADMYLYGGKRGMSELISHYDRKPLRQLIKKELLKVPEFKTINYWKDFIHHSIHGGVDIVNLSDYENDIQAVEIFEELYQRMNSNTENNVRALLASAEEMRIEIDARHDRIVANEEMILEYIDG